MTQNEAKEYINDINNWYVVAATEYARVRRLDYGDLHYAMIELKCILNMVAIYSKNYDDVKIGFRKSNCYKFDAEHNCLGYNVSETEIWKEIWKESKK